jgi:hypothetical protein
MLTEAESGLDTAIVDREVKKAVNMQKLHGLT